MILPIEGHFANEAVTFIIPLILGILAIIGAFITIFIQWRFLRMSFYSGKLRIHIVIIQLINSLLFTLSLFYVSNGQNLKYSQYAGSFYFVLGETSANILAFIEIHFSMAYSFSHFCMAHNLYISTKTTSTSINMKTRHIHYVWFTQGVALIIAILCAVFGGLGYQIIGVYGIYMMSRWQYVDLLVLGIIFPFAVFAILYSRYHNRRLDEEAIVEEEYEKEIRHDFVNTNCWNLTMYMITWVPYTLVSFVSAYSTYDCACLNEDDLFSAILKIFSFYLVIVSTFLSMIITITRSIVRKKFRQRLMRRSQNGIIHALLDETILEPDEENPGELVLNDDRGSFNIEARGKRVSIDESEIFKKQPFTHDTYKNKNVPMKKPIPPAEHLDILMAIIFNTNHYEFTIEDSFPETPWSKHEYSDCLNENLDMNLLVTEAQQDLLREKLKKQITFRNVNIISYSVKVFVHLLKIWKIYPKVLQETFNFNSNIEFFANIHRKPFSHLEKRYFHVTPNKKILLQVCEKEAKLYFVDTFLPAYHHYMANNLSSFIVKFLGLYTFNIAKSTHNVISILNCYEKFYGNDSNIREGNNTGIPHCIMERYLIDGKYIRHEVYEEGIQKKKIKRQTSEKDAKKIFYLPTGPRTEIINQLTKDLKFLGSYDIINYRVVFLRTRDNRRKVSLLERPQLETRGKYVTDGSIALDDGSILKIFIDTNLQTSKMKWESSKKKATMFSIENSDVYRQCIHEIINDIL